MSCPCTLIKIGPAEIGCACINANAQISSSPGSSEFNKDVPHLIDPFPELVERWFRTSDGYWVIAFCQPLYKLIHQKCSLLENQVLNLSFAREWNAYKV